MTQRERISVRALGRGRFRRPATAQPRDIRFLFETALPHVVRRRDLTFRRALLLADVVAALLAIGVTSVATGLGGAGLPGLALLVVVPLVNTSAGLYRRDELVLSTNTLDEAPAVLQACTFSTMATYFIDSALVAPPLGAQFAALCLASLISLTLLLRSGARTAARALTPPERCLFVGAPGAERRLDGRLSTAPAVKAELVGRWPLAATAALGEALRDTHAHRVVIDGDGAPAEQVHETIQVAKALGCRVSLLPRTFDVVGSSVEIDYLGGLTLLGLRRFGLSRRARAVKRALDCACSLSLLVLLAPLLVSIALAIRLSSPGGVLYRQLRVGRDGREFHMLKFRSMVDGADAAKAGLRVFNEADGLFKIRDDPRITLVGRVLRRTNLDELPQLINVLRGEMSLVGPRPLVVEEDRQVHGWYRRRLDLTPGMTGPWQVLGAARIPLREMVAIDYVYVANWSLWGDVKVLLRTVPCVLGRRGM